MVPHCVPAVYLNTVASLEWLTKQMIIFIVRGGWTLLNYFQKWQAVFEGLSPPWSCLWGIHSPASAEMLQKAPCSACESSALLSQFKTGVLHKNLCSFKNQNSSHAILIRDFIKIFQIIFYSLSKGRLKLLSTIKVLELCSQESFSFFFNFS